MELTMARPNSEELRDDFCRRALERTLELSGYLLVVCDRSLRVICAYGHARRLTLGDRLLPKVEEAIMDHRSSGGRVLSMPTNAVGGFIIARVEEGPGPRVIVWIKGGSPTRSAAAQALRERYGLNVRSQQLLSLLAQGLSNREIAEHLGLREATVKTYLHQLYETLGVRSRTAAIAELQRSLNFD